MRSMSDSGTGGPMSTVDSADARVERHADELDWADWRRSPPSPSQRRRDIGLACAVLAGAWLTVLLVNSMGMFVLGAPPALAEQLLWTGLMALSLAVRRQYPLTVLGVVGVLFIVGQLRQIGDNFVPSAVLFIAIYTVGAWSRNRVAARWGRATVIAAMFVWLGIGIAAAVANPTADFSAAAGPFDPLLALVGYNIGFNLLFFGTAHYFGNMAWMSARRQAKLEHQAWRLRQSQEENVRGALVSERMRIARDLHDVVAHHVSVVGVQAGAARVVVDTDVELARSTLRTVEENAREAIGELRGLLGVLRSGGDHATSPGQGSDTEPASPGIDQLPDLVATARSAGLWVEYGTYGQQRPVPESVGLTAYRIVQEALTNTVKHAGAAARADVRVRLRERALEVEVTDDGRGGPHPGEEPTLGGGFGLLGMRERVAVHGGSLDAGPRQGGGFRVRATLPTSREGAGTEQVDEETAV